jgi:arsenical pump membrane protein
VTSALAYSTLAVTVGLALARPVLAVTRRGAQVRLGPGLAGLIGLFLVIATRLVDRNDLTATAATLWRPLVTIASIMILAACAREAGLIDRAVELLARGNTSVGALHLRVFVVTTLATVLLNNDAAVLVFTPLVVTLVRKRYPGREDLVAPFAWSVFLAAGVAPLLVSNPMNMIVASTATYAGITFNGYAKLMIPIWLAGAPITYVLLRRAVPINEPEPYLNVNVTLGMNLNRRGLAIGVLLLAVLAAYPITTLLGGPLWPVAAAGALIALTLTKRPAQVVVNGVSWPILFFLYSVFAIAIALGKVGVIDLLSRHYAAASPSMVGMTSAFGSALVGNHPVAILNVLSLGKIGAPSADLYAAMIGGDLGPRLLPIGSLAGLIWLESLRAQKAHIPLGRFVRVGATVTLPVLLLSLALLGMLKS